LTRVLFLAESFHPVLGGGETHIRQLAAALVAAGDAATVVTRRGDAAWPAQDAVDGVRIVRVPPPGPGRTGKYLMVPAAWRAARREASRHDVLVVRGTRVLGLPGLLAARQAGCPVVMQPEINGELDGEAFTWGQPWAEGVAGRLARFALRLRNPWLRDADALVAMSARIADEARACGVAAERVALIRHGVDTVRFRPAADGEVAALRGALGLPAGTLAVYTGRLLRGKGLEDLLGALAAVADELPALHLVLVGSGAGQALSVEAELRARAAAPPLAGRVTFAGRSERVEDWLRAADLFVFPSLYEALGISLVEAQACGLPAVACRTGGIVDVVEHGRSGWLVEPGDARELAAALRRLATDAGERREMGKQSRAVAVARFDARDSFSRYRALFAGLSPRPAASRPGRAPRGGEGPPPSPGARA